MDKSLIINKIKSFYNIDSDSKFAEFLGIKPQVLSNWRARNSFDYELIYTKCVDIDGNWLLSNGDGDISRKKDKPSISKEFMDLLEERRETIELQRKHIALLEEKLSEKKTYKESSQVITKVAEDPFKLK